MFRANASDFNAKSSAFSGQGAGDQGPKGLSGLHGVALDFTRKNWDSNGMIFVLRLFMDLHLILEFR